MKKHVSVNKMGIIHGYAICKNSDCNWADGLDMDMEKGMQTLRNRINSHVKKTGHTVVLETAKSTHYSL